jgi:hypothetical protein
VPPPPDTFHSPLSDQVALPFDAKMSSDAAPSFFFSGLGAV